MGDRRDRSGAGYRSSDSLNVASAKVGVARELFQFPAHAYFVPDLDADLRSAGTLARWSPTRRATRKVRAVTRSC